MSSRTSVLTTGARRRAVALAAVVLSSAGVVAACAGEGSISLTSSADAVVAVRSGDEKVGDIEPGGGLQLFSDDCLDGSVVVTYPGGREIAFRAPLCPGQALLIEDHSVQVVAPSSG